MEAGQEVDAGAVLDEAGDGDWLLDQLALTLVRSELPVAEAASAAIHEARQNPKMAKALPAP